MSSHFEIASPITYPIILVHAVLDLVYSRLRHCVVYSNAVRCMRYMYRFHFNTPHSFLAAKFYPTSGSRRQGGFVVSIPPCCDFPHMSCKNKTKVIYAGSAVPLESLIEYRKLPGACIPSSSARFILCCLNTLASLDSDLKAKVAGYREPKLKS